MHGQRDLLDWQDEYKRENRVKGGARRKILKHCREKMLVMVSGVERGHRWREVEYLF